MNTSWPRRPAAVFRSLPGPTTRPAHAAPRSDANDAGSVSVMFVVLFAGLLILAGLLVDASRVLAANADASDLAAKAARAGAQEIDLASLRTGASVGAGTGNGTGGSTDRGPGAGPGDASGVALDRAAAEAAARDYLDRHGIDGTAEATGNTVTVTVRLHIPYTLLALSGAAGETVVQTRSAVATRGP